MLTVGAYISRGDIADRKENNVLHRGAAVAKDVGSELAECLTTASSLDRLRSAEQVDHVADAVHLCCVWEHAGRSGEEGAQRRHVRPEPPR